MRIAVYAGSFDPPTNGHLWMIQHGAKLFDRLIVAVGVNPKKVPMFTGEERLALLYEVLDNAGLDNVSLSTFPLDYLVRFARNQGADYVLRGVRNAADLEYEYMMRVMNAGIDPTIETIVLMPPPELAHVSSSSVKMLIGPQGWEHEITPYVPRSVHAALIRKASGE